MKRKIRSFIILLSVVIMCIMPVNAHSGRTDSSGGHRDTKNVSGLGPYHYHHGYGPHLHPNSVCPYDNASVAPSSAKPGRTESNHTNLSGGTKTSGASAPRQEKKKTKVMVTAEKTKIFKKASKASDEIVTVKKNYTFIPTGSTESFWQISFKINSRSDTVYTGYILKADCTEVS